MSAAAPRTKKRTLHIAVESAFATDPSSDGSGYTYVPAEGLQRKDEREILETEYATGRNYRTESEVGADGASAQFSTPAIGMATAAGDGTNASSVSDDWLDILLEHALGAQATLPGEGVASSGSGALTLDTDALSVQDLVPVFESSVPAGAERSQLAFIASDASDGSYTVEPGWTSNPTGAAVQYGVKRYTDTDAGGATLAACVALDSDTYVQLGGRINRCVIKAEHKKRVMIEWGMMFDRASEDAATKTALPAAAVLAPSAIKFFRSPVWFGGTNIPTKTIEIDFGLNAAELGDSAGTNGRSGNELISLDPVITVEPRYNDSWLDYKRNGTKGRLIGQLGAGVLGGGILNLMGYCFDRAEVYEADERDDSGHMRHVLKFRPVDRIEFTSGTAARFLQVIRA